MTASKDKTCVSSILAFLNRFENKSLKLKTLLELWKIEPRTYIYLQKALETDFVPNSEKQKVTFYVTKAHCILKICEMNPTKHGADLLKPLNDLLNDPQW